MTFITEAQSHAHFAARGLTGEQPDDPACEEGIVHYWCCDSTRAWCGKDISDERDCPEGCGCQECVVCALRFAEDCECTDGAS